MIKKILQNNMSNNNVNKLRIFKRKIFYVSDYLKIKKLFKSDQKRFMKNSFGKGINSDSFEQLEARITKEYHAIEKGLSYKNLRFGFGEQPLYNLLELLKKYTSKMYSIDSHCYKTAISTLYEYVSLHEEHNKENLIPVENLKQKVKDLDETNNRLGGVTYLNKEEIEKNLLGDFKEFSLSRHSVRDYSNEPVDEELLQQAYNLAQSTPSACNRQSWKVKIVSDKNMKKIIRENQNGNRGFGEYVDKFIVITSDTQYYAKPRERNQANIDGGMYAMNLLYALHYYGIATVSLSASLMIDQEIILRKKLNISESENFIMFIGVGNYTDEEFKVPRSDRRKMKLDFI